MPTLNVDSTLPRAASVVDVPVAADGLDALSPDERRFAEQQGFEAKVGQALALPGAEGVPSRVLLGLGDRAAVDADVLRRAAAAYVRAASRHLVAATTLLESAGPVAPDQALEAVVEGLQLASYRYTEFKQAPEQRLRRVTIVGRQPGLDAALVRAEAVAGAVTLARDLVNEPGGSLTPVVLAERAERAARAAGLEVEVWDEERIAAERLGGLLAVNKGSALPPRYVRLRYRPAGTPVASVALVGKGITFDSGGLSLKTGQGMMSMKIDMAGAAAVLGAMTALAAVGAPVEVRGELPLTDNMTGGDAQRPGDVFRARNGTTVEVLNTDAEGRLVLADALALAAEDEPDAIVDIATLTGACSVALGGDYAGIMGTGDDVLRRLEQASARTGEPVWRLPLPDRYRKQLDSPVADLKNISAGAYGGALVAGLFLREFVGDRPWAHIDLGMSAMAEADDGVVVRGATGIGVRLLIDALRTWAD